MGNGPGKKFVQRAMVLFGIAVVLIVLSFFVSFECLVLNFRFAGAIIFELQNASFRRSAQGGRDA